MSSCNGNVWILWWLKEILIVEVKEGEEKHNEELNQYLLKGGTAWIIIHN